MFTICLYRIFESGFILVLYYLLNLREAESISSVLDQRSWLIVSNTELQTQIHTHTHTLLNVIKIQNFNYFFGMDIMEMNQNVSKLRKLREEIFKHMVV